MTAREPLPDAAALRDEIAITGLLGRFGEGLRIASVVAPNEVPRSRAAAEARGITLGGRPG
jgi:hypothetical protein